MGCWSRVAGPAAGSAASAGIERCRPCQRADRETAAFRIPWENSLEQRGGQRGGAAARIGRQASSLSSLCNMPPVSPTTFMSDVHDYTCILIKRERIEDELQDFQTMRARVRCDRLAVGQPAVPFSVFLEFLGPPKVRGRKVLFVAGENDNKMLARNGGKRFNFVIVKLDPVSEAAMRESLVPITEMGLENMTRMLMRLLKENIDHDPAGKNSHLAFYKNAKVNERTCTRISVKHPATQSRAGI